MEVQSTFTGAKWIVEGDIKACFDNFDHHVLIDLLRRRIEDEYFISLMWKFLKGVIWNSGYTTRPIPAHRRVLV
jgi:retron-type reverse transcriptase